jgi:hypothetical protein
MCIIDDEDDIEENDNKKEEFNLEAMTPHISLNALEGTTGFILLRSHGGWTSISIHYGGF